MSRRFVLAAVAALPLSMTPTAHAQTLAVTCAGMVSCSWTAAAPTGLFAYAAVAPAANYTIACTGGGGLSVDIVNAGADVRTFEQAGRCTLTFTVTTGPAVHSVLVAQQDLA